MALEIERKFLVLNDDYKKVSTGVLYKQGYLCRMPGRTVRVRTADSMAWLTIKSSKTGITRLEFEYPIPYEDALSLLKLCNDAIIEKIRYKIAYEGMIWEVDEFLGHNKGLVVAEIELESENQAFKLPPWIGKEVTGDPKYYNSNLINSPCKN